VDFVIVIYCDRTIVYGKSTTYNRSRQQFFRHDALSAHNVTRLCLVSHSCYCMLTCDSICTQHTNSGQYLTCFLSHLLFLSTPSHQTQHHNTHTAIQQPKHPKLTLTHTSKLTDTKNVFLTLSCALSGLRVQTHRIPLRLRRIPSPKH
jgi:hypothetical protein